MSEPADALEALDLSPAHRAMVEFYANPANSLTYNNEIRAAQAAGLEHLAPGQIRNLFRRKKIASAIRLYSEQHGITAPVRTADDEESERQDKMLDEMIGLNVLDMMEQVEIVRVDDRGNEYVERHYQPKSLDEIRPMGKFVKGVKLDQTKYGQRVDLTFHDKLSAKKLRDTIKKRIGDGGAGGHAPVVNIFIPSLGGGQQPQVVNPATEGGEDAET